MNTTDLRHAADLLWEAWTSGVPCRPVRDLLGKGDVDAAYEVQRINTDRQLATGDEIVGYKIGLTSEAVQRQLGVDQPDFGPLFASRRVENAGSIDLATCIEPRVEAEIAIVLARDITDPEVDPADIAAATAYVAPSLEIIDSRVRDWDITITDTVADFASGAMFVLGTDRTSIDSLDLSEVPMELVANGSRLSSGSGAATLGHPLVAAAWLARTLIGHGLKLREGDVILSGALGPFVSLLAGQTSVADLGVLGTVSCSA